MADLLRHVGHEPITTGNKQGGTLAAETTGSQRDPMKRKNTRPGAIRLSEELMKRLDDCARQLAKRGLTLNRSEIARLLIKRALDAFHCDAIFSVR